MTDKDDRELTDINDAFKGLTHIETKIPKIKIKAKRYVVTERQFKTLRRTYKISKIEKTEIRRNLIFFLPISILTLLFTYKFYDYLYSDEVFYLTIIPLILATVSVLFGTLYIYSKALGEPAMFGLIHTLKNVRWEVDEAMTNLEEKTEGYRKDYDLDG